MHNISLEWIKMLENQSLRVSEYYNELKLEFDFIQRNYKISPYVIKQKQSDSKKYCRGNSAAEAQSIHDEIRAEATHSWGIRKY